MNSKVSQVLSPIEKLRFHDQALFFAQNYFRKEQFLEIRTPTLVSNPGLEPHLDYFQTQYIGSMGDTGCRTLFLPTSPEYHIKKALSWAQSDSLKIFEIAKSFRNGELSKEHRPEFLMLEFYMLPATLKELSDFCWNFIEALAQNINPQNPILPRYDFDLETLFVDLCATNFERLRNLGSFEERFFDLFMNKIEPFILQQKGLSFIWNFPIEVAALSKALPHSPEKCSRFELYIHGIEIGNAFQELLDKESLVNRMEKDLELRKNLNKDQPPVDLEFLEACDSLKTKEIAGIAIGWDRLLQVLNHRRSLDEILLFPFEKNDIVVK